MPSPTAQPGVTSGDSSFIVSGGDLFRQAALKCNAIDAGTPMSAQLQTDFMLTANLLLRTWRNSGMHLWKEKEAYLFPRVGQVRYAMSLQSTDHFAVAFFQSALSVTAVAGATTLQCPTTGVDKDGVPTQMNLNDQIGIVLDSGDFQWATVQSLTATTVTIAGGPLASQASSGAAVFTYTPNANATSSAAFARPLRLQNRRRRNILSTIEIPIDPLSRKDWDDIPYKTQVGGTIFRSYFDLQREAAYLYINQPPQTVTDLVGLTVTLPIEDFTSANNNPDLPEEWYLCLLWNIAKEHMFGFNCPAQRRAEIQQNASTYLGMMETEDREETSIFITPNYN